MLLKDEVQASGVDRKPSLAAYVGLGCGTGLLYGLQALSKLSRDGVDSRVRSRRWPSRFRTAIHVSLAHSRPSREPRTLGSRFRHCSRYGRVCGGFLWRRSPLRLLALSRLWGGGRRLLLPRIPLP